MGRSSLPADGDGLRNGRGTLYSQGLFDHWHVALHRYLLCLTYVAATHQSALLKIVIPQRRVPSAVGDCLPGGLSRRWWLDPGTDRDLRPTPRLVGCSRATIPGHRPVGVERLIRDWGLGYHGRELTKLTAKAGLINLLSLIYFGLVIGALSMSQWLSPMVVALSQIVGTTSVAWVRCCWVP